MGQRWLVFKVVLAWVGGVWCSKWGWGGVGMAVCMEKERKILGRKIHLMVQGCPSPHLTDVPCIPCGPPHVTPSETHGLAGAWGSEGVKGKTRL